MNGLNEYLIAYECIKNNFKTFKKVCNLSKSQYFYYKSITSTEEIVNNLKINDFFLIKI